ncbi:MAG TPA: tandem-95 repeat protein [Gammaproteobacteria bacterium]|nr:tandem-95 repeat protein [Gammaproteobacteria bacterium]
MATRHHQRRLSRRLGKVDRAGREAAPVQTPRTRKGLNTCLSLAALFLGLITMAGMARADLSVASLTQSGDPVLLGSPVTYSLTVSSNSATGAPEFLSVDIRDSSGTSLTPQSMPAMNSTGCAWDGLWFCSDVLPGQAVTVTFTWTPPAGNSNLTFTLGCSPSCGGGSASITTRAGQAPNAADDPGNTTPMNTAIAIDVLLNDSDPQNSPLSVERSISPPPANGTAEVNPDNTITYRPKPGYTGPDSFGYTIRNALGFGDAATVSVNVTVPAPPPPVANDDNAVTPPGTDVLIPVLENDNGQGLPLSLDSVTQPANGTASIGTGGISYTPNASFVGTDSFVYRVSTTSGSDSATVTVTVSAGFVAKPLAVNTTSGKPVVIDLVASNSGAVAAVIASPPQNGTAVLKSDGTVTYTPKADFTGKDSFDYTVSDGDGQNATGTVTVTITAGFIASTVNANARSGQAVVIDLIESNNGAAAVEAIGTPRNGTAALNTDGTVIYTPRPGFAGVDSFDYTIRDGSGRTATGTVSVSVSTAAQTATPTDLASLPGLTDQQLAVAQVMDGVCAAVETGELAQHCAAIAGMSSSDQTNALDQLVPDQLHSMGTQSVEATTTQLANVKARMLELRGGGLGLLSLSRLRLAITGTSVPLGALAQAALQQQAADDGDAAVTPSPRFGVFVNGRINLGEKATTGREVGFDFSTQGVTLGMDYRFSDRFFMGGALGYAAGSADFDVNAGELDTRSTSLSVYGSYYQSERFYLDWMLSVAQSDYELNRTIVFSGVNTVATGKPDGSQYGGAVNFGADYHLGSVLLSPYARLEYVAATVDAYTESGGSGFALAVDEQTVRSLTTALALRLSRTHSLRWGVLVPALHAEWEHEYSDDSRDIRARFANAPGAGSFTLTTDNPDRDYFNLGANVSAVTAGGKAFFLSYEAVLGQANMRNSTIEFGFRAEF